ncbi:MAG: ABC transporter ATP-binding protein [Eubacteriales bacterium]
MLKIENISKTFNKGSINENTALKSVSLKMERGEFITVIGSNGAGKSTLLNAIAGNFPVDCGKIIIDNKDVTKFPQHKRANFISRVFQDPMSGTAASMKIEENLVMALKRGEKRRLRWAIKQRERTFFCEELKKLDLGLEDRLSARVSLLSGGQRQALTLLMATFKEPKLLLLDEHTAALDPKTAEKVLNLTCNVAEATHQTTIMITHNLEHALSVGNRTIMMHEGNIILDIKGEERKNVKIAQLMKMFEQASGANLNTDRMLFS